MAAAKDDDKIFGLSTEKLLMLILAAFLGFSTFKDDVFKNDSNQELVISKLTIQVENLTAAVSRLEVFSRSPRFTEEDYEQSHAEYERMLYRHSDLLENRGSWMNERDLFEQSIISRMQHYEERLKRVEDKE